MSSQWGSRNWNSTCRSFLAWKNTSFKERGGGKNVKREGREVWEKFFDKLSSLSLIPINSFLLLMSQFFCLHLSLTHTQTYTFTFLLLFSHTSFPQTSFLLFVKWYRLFSSFFLHYCCFSLILFYLSMLSFLSPSLSFPIFFPIPNNNNKRVLTKKMYFPHPSLALINLSDIFFSSRKHLTPYF